MPHLLTEILFIGVKGNLFNGVTSKVLKRQNHACGECGLKFTDGESIHLHYVNGSHDTWDPKNLLAVRESCHDYIRMRQPKKLKIVGS